MKALTPLLTVLLTSAIAVAQSTTPVNRSTTAPNRQQELYDQYHGVTRRTASKTATTNPSTSKNSTAMSTSNAPAPQPAPAPMTEATPAPTPASQSSMKRTATMNRATLPETGMAYDGPGMRIGVRGGLTYLFFLENQSTAIGSVKASPGFVGGITFTFGSGAIAFQPEVNYARYGTNVTTTFGIVTNTNRLTVDYLEVPLLLKFQSGSYAGNRFFFNIGPYGSYGLSVAVDGKKQTLSQSDSRYGYGAVAGLGAAIKAGPGHVVVEARGHYQLGDFSRGFYTDSKTIFGQATIGYAFALGGRR